MLGDNEVASSNKIRNLKLFGKKDEVTDLATSIQPDRYHSAKKPCHRSVLSEFLVMSRHTHLVNMSFFGCRIFLVQSIPLTCGTRNDKS